MADEKVVLKFGSKEYEVKSPTIRKGREWRAKILPMITEIAGSMDAISNPENLGKAMQSHPDEISEIVLTFDESLPREEILELATEQEMADAFSMIMILAFKPMVQAIGTIRSVWAVATQPTSELLKTVLNTKSAAN